MKFHDAQTWFNWLEGGGSPFECVAMITRQGQLLNLLAFPLELIDA